MKESLEDIYQREVLGLKSFRAPPASVNPDIKALPLVVECEDLTDDTRSLLHKILGSVGLKNWAQIRIDEPVEAPVEFWLKFSGVAPYGKAGSIWSLPTLTEMSGSDEKVQLAKKACWAVLQNFKREWVKR